MDNVSSRVKLMGNLQAAVAEAVSGTMEERGRGFASDREAWAELKECIERTKQMHTDIEKVHKEMWSAVKDRNEDAFAALSQEFERSSRILAEEWAQTSALAKIAVISEEGANGLTDTRKTATAIVAWSNVAKRNAKRYAARIWSVASFTSRAILTRDTERR